MNHRNVGVMFIAEKEEKANEKLRKGEKEIERKR
jgi:hypothetical protein